MTDHPFKPILLDLLQQTQHDQEVFLQELTTAERAAIGTPEHWSAKDHIAHMTYWRQRLVLRLQAILRKGPHPKAVDFEQLNPIIFEEQRHRPWPDILSESDHVYAELMALSDQLTEEDLTALNRFDWIPNQEPLYTVFMGNWYEHTQQHLAQYYLDRHDLPRGIGTYEVWARRIIEAEVPEMLKGIALYNLACFYAARTPLEKASATLQQALLFAPHLKEWSLNDPDLAVLRQQSA